MSKFTDFAEMKDAIGFKNTFQDAVAEKVSAALENFKTNLAQSIFKNNDEVNEEAENVEEEKIEMTRGGRATGNAIKDIVAKNNARIAKKKADAEKAEKKKNS